MHIFSNITYAHKYGTVMHGVKKVDLQRTDVRTNKADLQAAAVSISSNSTRYYFIEWLAR
jgi:hypothetical protein